jgi:5-methylcytosine-specific restriction protein B
MADYFTNDHFKLLNKWKGTVYDKTNPEQQAVYQELRQAYDLTKRWAEAVQQSLFPMGWSRTVRKPIDQWQKKFIPYNWGRIYPYPDAPEELAYTVGIDADLGFVVKIDVVDTQTEDPTLRPRYEAIRGPMTASPIVAVLPATEGLAKSFPELVAWSVEAIRNFKLRYDDLVAQLNLGKTLSDEDLLKHFDGKPAFKTFRASWSPQNKALFCRLARAVHAAGLDWWHMSKGIQVRFGRKNPGSERAVGVLGLVSGTQGCKLTWTRPVGPVPKLDRALLTDDLVAKIEAALAAERDSLDDWLVLENERPGLWPDQLRDDPPDPGADPVDESGDAEKTRQPINRIYYGPPGTGKTYELSKLLQREYEQATDSIPPETWRKQLITTEIASLTWWEAAAAALYELGGEAKVAQLYAHPFIQAVAAAKGRNKNVKQTLWGTLQHHTVEQSSTVKIRLRLAPAVFDKSQDSVWRFAGTWEEDCADVIDIVKRYKQGPPLRAPSRATASSPSISPTATRSSSRACGQCWVAIRRRAKSSTRSARACSRTCAAGPVRHHTCALQW